ncbi:hypothetical protein SK128_018645, partial [Halocaridina rubra]
MGGLECDVCVNYYNGDDRKPRTLACAHTSCALCTINGITEAEVTCPSCQRLHHAVGPRDIPVSLSLLRVLIQRSIGGSDNLIENVHILAEMNIAL